MRAGQEKTAAIVRAYNCDSSRLIAILQEIQAAENYPTPYWRVQGVQRGYVL